MLFRIYSALEAIEGDFKVRCAHNEFRIIALLDHYGALPSLELMRLTGRSISGHNTDLKRLLELGILERQGAAEDRRSVIYRLSEPVASALGDIIGRESPDLIRSQMAPSGTLSQGRRG